MNEARRPSSEVLTRTGGIFWGLVLVVLGLISLLAAMGLLVINPAVVFAVLLMLGGAWLIMYKVMPEKFP